MDWRVRLAEAIAAHHTNAPPTLYIKMWPNCERCVQGAPPNHGDTGPDIRRADFTRCA
jgi:hypothetical protein